MFSTPGHMWHFQVEQGSLYESGFQALTHVFCILIQTHFKLEYVTYDNLAIVG